jgi:uncharacterized protein (DUF1697 family)
MRRVGKPPATIFVALLRGVNVGGKNMISMSSLKDSFATMGFEDVTTYINSGNIIFKAAESQVRKLERNIEEMLAREYELDCKVVVRSFSEITNLVESLPKNWNDDKHWKYNVIFLRHSLDSETIFEHLPPMTDVDQVVHRPGALLWSVRIGDVSRSIWLKLPSRKIFQDMTVRNLNTTRKLYELMKKMSECS